MDATIEVLLAALSRSQPDPGPAGAELPSPWETWTLIGLVRHRERQLWVAGIMKTRLSGNPSDLAEIGALGHPEGAQSGTVPGMPEWEYYFHGRGCCFTHKVEGDAIDVDFTTTRLSISMVSFISDTWNPSETRNPRKSVYGNCTLQFVPSPSPSMT
jgi:hypothetical protein